jgi:hypothetical protein
VNGGQRFCHNGTLDVLEIRLLIQLKILNCNKK